VPRRGAPAPALGRDGAGLRRRPPHLPGPLTIGSPIIATFAGGRSTTAAGSAG